jgi:hypothetical protein
VQIPSFNIVSAEVLHVLGDRLTGAENTIVVTSLREVRQALDVYGARPPAPAVTVDLHGHSTRDHPLHEARFQSAVRPSARRGGADEIPPLRATFGNPVRIRAFLEEFRGPPG